MKMRGYPSQHCSASTMNLASFLQLAGQQTSLVVMHSMSHTHLKFSLTTTQLQFPLMVEQKGKDRVLSMEIVQAVEVLQNVFADNLSNLL